MSKVALVTGSNKGIGYATVEGLCKVFKGTVYLSGRDEERVRLAAEQLRSKGHDNVKTCRIDLNDKQSILDVRDMMKQTFGGIDVLVNNAAMAYKGSDTTPFDVQARVTMDTDYHALVDLCDILFPILKSGARVVHLSSMCSMFAFRKCSDERKQEVLKCDTIAAVTGLMNKFVDLAQSDQHSQAGFPSHGYGMAKMGVALITPIQQKTMDKQTQRSDITINCCCPGYVNTDMTSHRGTKTPEQGAETPLILALLPPSTPMKGLYFTEGKPSDWTEGYRPVHTELLA